MKRIAAILILAATAACTPYWAKDRADHYAKCPDVRLLEPARSWIGPPDDTAWTTRGNIDEFGTACELTKTTVEMKITVNVQMERAQHVDQEEKLTFPLFIAVMRGDDIISKQVIQAPIKFSEDKKSAEVGVELPASLPFIDDPGIVAQNKTALEKDPKAEPKDPHTAADRSILIGFQLTDAQRAYFQKLRDAPVVKVNGNP